MSLKPTGRFYIIFEVELNSMVVTLRKDNKRSKEYSAHQYFKYFSEYGVRKTDRAILSEKFSISYFQQMLLEGKDEENFEFCTDFGNKQYKIIKGRIIVAEGLNENIIKIILEDISHKRVQLLENISEHFNKNNTGTAAQVFNIKFEQDIEPLQVKGLNYKLLAVCTSILYFLLAAYLLYETYGQGYYRHSGEDLFIDEIIAILMMTVILPIGILSACAVKEKENRAILEKMAYTDRITGGKNANYFDIHAENLIKNTQNKYAMVFTKLTMIREYNEKYHCLRGDANVKLLFYAMERNALEDELICRVYADNILFLMRYGEVREIDIRLEEIGRTIADTSFKLEFGVCLINDNYVDIKEIEVNAKRALQNKPRKEERNVRISYYDRPFTEKILFDRRLESRIYQAFRDGEFKILVEPRYDLKTRAVCGGDVTAIWNYPSVGMLLPQEYIGILEGRDLIAELDAFVFQQVCIKLNQNIMLGRNPMPLTIRLHKNPTKSEVIINKLRDIYEKYQIQGKYLAFEISEEAAGRKGFQTKLFSDFVHNIGAGCVIDQYTAGRVSIRQLQSMGVDTIKFSLQFTENGVDKAVAESIIGIGKALDISTVAVGVENQKQLRYLIEKGCEQAKGDVFVRNISLDDYISIF